MMSKKSRYVSSVYLRLRFPFTESSLCHSTGSYYQTCREVILLPFVPNNWGRHNSFSEGSRRLRVLVCLLVQYGSDLSSTTTLSVWRPCRPVSLPVGVHVYLDGLGDSSFFLLFRGLTFNVSFYFLRIPTKKFLYVKLIRKLSK